MRGRARGTAARARGRALRRRRRLHSPPMATRPLEAALAWTMAAGREAPGAPFPFRTASRSRCPRPPSWVTTRLALLLPADWGVKFTSRSHDASTASIPAAPTAQVVPPLLANSAAFAPLSAMAVSDSSLFPVFVSLVLITVAVTPVGVAGKLSALCIQPGGTNLHAHGHARAGQRNRPRRRSRWR